jgi:serine/threonine protein kinase
MDSPGLKTIFNEALERPVGPERVGYLDDACRDDAERREVEALLSDHDRMGRFLKPATGSISSSVQTARREPCDPPSGDRPVEPVADDRDGKCAPPLGPPRRADSLGRISHYKLIEEVGRGGMGVVYKAFDKKLRRVVAIKVMLPEQATIASARGRFLREARSAAAVVHDHVIAIHEVADNPKSGRPFLVMPYIAGQSLQQRIDSDGPLRIEEVLRIGSQIALGLDAAHAKGLVHRDIKPANILLENGVERVKITDFGLARAADDPTISTVGAVIGTPYYMSPEQARGECVDERTDLFSFGSTLYTMCTGKPPFKASSRVAVLHKVCQDEPEPIQALNPAIPEWLVEIVARLQAKDPRDRYRSAAEVETLLSDRLVELQGPSRPADEPVVIAADPGAKPHFHEMFELPGPSPAGYRRSRWWLAVVVGILMVGLIVAWAALNVVIRTPEGIITLKDLPAQASVLVDGKVVSVQWPGGGGPAEIRVVRGKHLVEVKKDGFTAWGQKVVVGRGREALIVQLDPIPTPLSEKREQDPRGPVLPAAPEAGATGPDRRPTPHDPAGNQRDADELRRFVVFDGSYHVFVPGNPSPSGAGVRVGLDRTDRLFIRIAYDPHKQDWVRLPFLHGDTVMKPPRMFSLYEALGAKQGDPIVLRLQARSVSRATVGFAVGGHEGDNSVTRTEFRSIPATWSKVQIDLSEEDMSSVHAALVVHIDRFRNAISAEPIILDLDQIYFAKLQKPPKAE